VREMKERRNRETDPLVVHITLVAYEDLVYIDICMLLRQN
jgi:hypothetical protein